MNSDHQLIEFSMDLRIKRQPHIERRLYNFKKADWNGLKYSLSLINWDLCFGENDINACLTNWSDTFLAAVDQHIPTSKPRNVNEHPWIDHELLNLIKVKNKLRNVFIKRGSTLDHDRFRQARREVKAMINMKKKQSAAKLKDSLLTNIRRFWSLVKSTTKQNRSLLQSVFSPNDSTSESYQGPSVIPAHHLSEIRLTIPEVIKVLEDIHVNKAHGPDNIPGRLLKETAPEIASPVCRLFSLSLSLGKFPDQWNWLMYVLSTNLMIPHYPRTTDQFHYCVLYLNA